MNPMIASPRATFLALCALTLTLLGCQSGGVRPSTAYVGNSVAPGAAAPPPVTTPLDVGIGVFEDGVVDLDPEQRVTTPSVRRAEAHYMPQVLADTVARRGGFGQVRVIPRRQTEMDIWLDGRIIESTGVELELEVSVSDAKGRVWYTKKYDHEVNRYVYDPDPTLARRDPFQPLYDEITDDLVRELSRRPANELAELRAITQLQFAQRFAPEQFNDYLGRDERGQVTVKRLPALDDPAFARLNDIRLRDRMFSDQVGLYYATYAERMAAPYDNWRRASHDELVAMRKLKGSEIARKVGGALAMLGGLAAVAAGDSAVGAAGIAGIAGGAYLFKSGVDKGAQAQLHSEALNELAESMGGDMRPHHITLSDQTVTLSGTVEEQYAQWRGLLRELYVAENAGAAPVLPHIAVDAPAAAPGSPPPANAVPYP